MSVGEVAITPRCAECGDAGSPTTIARWQAHRIDIEPDDEPAIAFWCRECAEREFDD
jgi:hypothetical protein